MEVKNNLIRSDSGCLPGSTKSGLACIQPFRGGQLPCSEFSKTVVRVLMFELLLHLIKKKERSTNSPPTSVL